MLVDWLNGVPEVVAHISSLSRDGHVLATCSINVAETYSGVREEDWGAVDPLFDSLEYWDIDRTVAKHAGLYRYLYARRGQPLTVTDTLLASLAVSANAVLITSNIRDFPMPELRLEKLPPG